MFLRGGRRGYALASAVGYPGRRERGRVAINPVPRSVGFPITPTVLLLALSLLSFLLEGGMAFSIQADEEVELLKVPSTCAALPLTRANITLPASNSGLRDLMVKTDGGENPLPPPQHHESFSRRKPLSFIWHFKKGRRRAC